MSRPETPLAALYSGEEQALMTDVEVHASRVPRGVNLSEFYQARWKELYSTDGIFRSNLEACKTRTLPGRWGVVLHCDATWVKGKRVGGKKPHVPVYQDFDPSKFNFTKANPVETMFWTHIPVQEPRGKEEEEEESEAVPPHAVMVNVSPLYWGHSLLLPYMRECLPQVLSPDMLVLALQFLEACATPDMRIGFNSLGGYASVNHLHFQSFQVRDLFEASRCPCETAPLRHLWDCQAPPEEECDSDVVDSGTTTHVSVFEILEWPVRGFLLKCKDGARDAKALADVAGTLACVLIADNIGHNLLVGSLGESVYLFPRRPQEPSGDGAFNAAFVEIAGLAVLKKLDRYDEFKEQDYVAAMEEVSLSPEAFAAVKRDFLSAVGGSSETAEVTETDGKQDS